MQESQKGLSASVKTDYETNDWDYITWVNAESIGFWEKLEINIFKFITIFPVIITFSLLGILCVFYYTCYLHPCLIGDYSSTLGIQDYWANSADRENDRYWAQILVFVMAFLVINLLLSLILTICTDPGGIPQDKEWDMPDEFYRPKVSIKDDNTSQEGNSDEEFNNREIVEDQQAPKELDHFYYRYLKSKAGPVFINPPQDDCSMDPVKAHLVGQLKNNQSHQILSFERKKYGGIRLCQRCLKTKPDRTHHCSQCNKCILKMDHHCPWVGNCIGFYNYKYFLNMLFYVSIATIIVVITTYPVFIAVLGRDKVDIRISYFVITCYLLACALCLLLVIFFSFHLWLLSNQYTTIEFFEKRSNQGQYSNGSPYNKGCFSNFQQVLGKNCLFWCCNFGRNLEGDGLYFEVKDELKQKVIEKMNEQTEGKEELPENEKQQLLEKKISE